MAMTENTATRILAFHKMYLVGKVYKLETMAEDTAFSFKGERYRSVDETILDELLHLIKEEVEEIDSTIEVSWPTPERVDELNMITKQMIKRQRLEANKDA